MQVIPLRDMLLVEPEAPASRGLLTVIRPERAAKTVTVKAVGPEVREVKVGQRVIVNTIAGTQVGGAWLVSQRAVLGTL